MKSKIQLSLKERVMVVLGAIGVIIVFMTLLVVTGRLFPGLDAYIPDFFNRAG